MLPTEEELTEEQRKIRESEDNQIVEAIESETIVSSKDVIKTTDNKTKYWYHVTRGTGPIPYHGRMKRRDGYFYKSVKYESVHFNSFEECYRDYVAFKPPKLVLIGSESFIYVNDNKEHVTFAEAGILFYDNAETELGTTEDEFDKIIATYNV